MKHSSLFDSFSSKGFSELRQRIFFVLLILIVYRIGTFIPIPGIDSAVMSAVENERGAGVLGILNTFTGGALGRMSIFALNIVPYITASIVMQLLSVVVKSLEVLRKEGGDMGRKQIAQYTKYLTVVLALVQGYGIAVGLEKLNMQYHNALISHPGLSFRIVAALSMVGGTVVVMWLSEQISTKGIGNGSSLIIFAGIVSGLPRAIAVLFEFAKTGAYSLATVFGILALIVFLVSLVVLLEKAQRRILVQYPKRQVGNRIMGGSSIHLPLKINTAGVIPPIFAGSLLSFPATVTGFQSNASGQSSFANFISHYFSSGQPLYVLCYMMLIMGFCFLYTSIIFNPTETAENLRKNGGVVLGKRPGAQTASYFDHVLTRLTVLGSIYIALICAVPEMLVYKLSLPFYLGGTSLLIVVNVIIDMFTQIQSYMLSGQYAKLANIAGLKLRK